MADGKARTIQHMMMTTFWHPDGTLVTSLQFMEMLFGKLPEFFKDEAELRALWCEPATRKKLLEGLTDKGFGREQLTEMQRMIDAEKSDLFDVLAHVAYALSPLSREERAAMAKIQILTHFNDKQQAFLDFVLAHYVSVGAEELDQEGTNEIAASWVKGLPQVGFSRSVRLNHVGIQRCHRSRSPLVSPAIPEGTNHNTTQRKTPKRNSSKI